MFTFTSIPSRVPTHIFNAEAVAGEIRMITFFISYEVPNESSVRMYTCKYSSNIVNTYVLLYCWKIDNFVFLEQSFRITPDSKRIITDREIFVIFYNINRDNNDNNVRKFSPPFNVPYTTSFIQYLVWFTRKYISLDTRHTIPKMEIFANCEVIHLYYARNICEYVVCSLDIAPCSCSSMLEL